MPLRCGVSGCKRPGVRFKPKSPEQMRLWKERIKFSGTATVAFAVCEHHFGQEQFLSDPTASKFGISARKRLKDDALPDLEIAPGTTAFELPVASFPKIRKIFDDSINNNGIDLQVH